MKEQPQTQAHVLEQKDNLGDERETDRERDRKRQTETETDRQRVQTCNAAAQEWSSSLGCVVGPPASRLVAGCGWPSTTVSWAHAFSGPRAAR